ncbi:hypothetical protein KIH39_10040 [Telmatocola sphagniphila]|uniref:Uncharacterized protein n=1 Tax=Telmatocola sphagniphila TaxID=1123043 RepID=A0A8E6EZY8_9BACT|nr:hypothetical protein [Telmatocola sphagniphila]QVL34223.1 hypothetical protein KIH39_10040 [Telmatocola sphagniphila]
MKSKQPLTEQNKKKPARKPNQRKAKLNPSFEEVFCALMDLDELAEPNRGTEVLNAANEIAYEILISAKTICKAKLRELGRSGITSK